MKTTTQGILLDKSQLTTELLLKLVEFGPVQIQKTELEAIGIGVTALRHTDRIRAESTMKKSGLCNVRQVTE